MATKNLARTVIEGGRSRWSRNEARYETRRERRRAKAALRPDRDLDDTLIPRRRSFELSQNDKLRPAMRWLASNCGRPWDKVHGELVATYDTRTVAGAHVVLDHMVREVALEGSIGAGGSAFLVGRGGILKRNKGLRGRW